MDSLLPDFCANPWRLDHLHRC